MQRLLRTFEDRGGVAQTSGKDALRKLCEETGEGFVEEVAGLGSFELKAGCEAKLKGISSENEPLTGTNSVVTRPARPAIIAPAAHRTGSSWRIRRRPQ